MYCLLLTFVFSGEFEATKEYTFVREIMLNLPNCATMMHAPSLCRTLQYHNSRWIVVTGSIDYAWVFGLLSIQKAVMWLVRRWEEEAAKTARAPHHRANLFDHHFNENYVAFKLNAKVHEHLRVDCAWLNGMLPMWLEATRGWVCECRNACANDHNENLVLIPSTLFLFLTIQINCLLD